MRSSHGKGTGLPAQPSVPMESTDVMMSHRKSTKMRPSHTQLRAKPSGKAVAFPPLASRLHLPSEPTVSGLGSPFYASCPTTSTSCLSCAFGGIIVIARSRNRHSRGFWSWPTNPTRRDRLTTIAARSERSRS
jgi:hypothetical protein